MKIYFNRKLDILNFIVVIYFYKVYTSNLELNKISKEIEDKHKFTFSLNDILSRLIYGRILSPSSKHFTIGFSEKLLKYKYIELHHFYRTLEIISQESDFIQEQLYKNSRKIISRNTNILYYGCTNLYFEIEECFKIIKNEFKSRFVYLSRKNRIKAHFMTCFLSLTLFRLSEQKLDSHVSYVKLIQTLRNYKFKRFLRLRCTPVYTRTEIIDLL